MRSTKKYKNLRNKLSGKVLTHHYLYSLIYKPANSIIKDITSNAFGINAKLLVASLDPNIPLTQYAMYGIAKTNEYQDLSVTVSAGLIEDSPTTSFVDSQATKALIKDSTKIFCKHSALAYANNKMATSFMCEVGGIFLSTGFRQYFSNKAMNYNFWNPLTLKALVEAAIKIPASQIKIMHITKNQELSIKFVSGEWLYRIVINTGKSIFEEIEKTISSFNAAEDLKPIEPIVTWNSAENICMLPEYICASRHKNLDNNSCPRELNFANNAISIIGHAYDYDSFSYPTAN